jgi:hypothetical protein
VLGLGIKEDLDIAMFDTEQQKKQQQDVSDELSDAAYRSEQDMKTLHFLNKNKQ